MGCHVCGNDDNDRITARAGESVEGMRPDFFPCTRCSSTFCRKCLNKFGVTHRQITAAGVNWQCPRCDGRCRCTECAPPKPKKEKRRKVADLRSSCYGELYGEEDGVEQILQSQCILWDTAVQSSLSQIHLSDAILSTWSAGEAGNHTQRKQAYMDYLEVLVKELTPPQSESANGPFKSKQRFSPCGWRYPGINRLDHPASVLDDIKHTLPASEVFKFFNQQRKAGERWFEMETLSWGLSAIAHAFCPRFDATVFSPLLYESLVDNKEVNFNYGDANSGAAQLFHLFPACMPASTKVAVVPVELDGKHWVSMYVIPPLQHVFYVDTKPNVFRKSEAQQIMDELCGNVKMFLYSTGHFPLALDWTHSPELPGIPTQKDTDNFTCGPLTLWVTLAIVRACASVWETPGDGGAEGRRVKDRGGGEDSSAHGEGDGDYGTVPTPDLPTFTSLLTSSLVATIPSKKGFDRPKLFHILLGLFAKPAAPSSLLPAIS